MAHIQRTKRHADFQDGYRRSSNFGSTVKNEKFIVTGDGRVILNKDYKPTNK